MSRPTERAASMLARSIVGLVLVSSALGAIGQEKRDAKFPGVGRPALPAEIKAWDIDVRADFTGLPKGRGSVAKGQDVWDAQCASCHGVFGESNEFFTPIVGGTKQADVESGRVGSLKSGEQRTTLMKLSRISTLWDYINRAMPWNAPKTLTIEEVYAVTAYILNLADLVPGDFTLSDENIASVQSRLPNRNDGTRNHGLWDLKAKPDVMATACMKDCPATTKVESMIPDHARNAHGILLAQNRLIGPTRGADTSKPPITGPAGAASTSLRAAALATTSTASSSGGAVTDGPALFQKNACAACHAPEQKTVGPSVKDIAGKYGSQTSAEATLAGKIKAGGAGVWGDVPMPPQPQVSEEDVRGILRWLLSGAK